MHRFEFVFKQSNLLHLLRSYEDTKRELGEERRKAEKAEMGTLRRGFARVQEHFSSKPDIMDYSEGACFGITFYLVLRLSNPRISAHTHQIARALFLFKSDLFSYAANPNSVVYRDLHARWKVFTEKYEVVSSLLQVGRTGSIHTTPSAARRREQRGLEAFAPQHAIEEPLIEYVHQITSLQHSLRYLYLEQAFDGVTKFPLSFWFFIEDIHEFLIRPQTLEDNTSLFYELCSKGIQHHEILSRTDEDLLISENTRLFQEQSHFKKFDLHSKKHLKCDDPAGLKRDVNGLFQRMLQKSPIPDISVLGPHLNSDTPFILHNFLAIFIPRHVFCAWAVTELDVWDNHVQTMIPVTKYFLFDSNSGLHQIQTQPSVRGAEIFDFQTDFDTQNEFDFATFLTNYVSRAYLLNRQFHQKIHLSRPIISMSVGILY